MLSTEMSKPNIPPSDHVIEVRLRMLREAQARRLRIIEADQQHAEETRVHDRIKPTKVTKDRLTHDPIEAMHERGTLSDAMADCALEIRRIFTAIQSGALVAAQDMNRTGRGVVTMSEWLAGRHKERFKPWAQRLSEFHARGGPPVLEIVIDVAVMSRTLSEVDTERRARHGTASMAVVYGLALYAHMAGEESNLAIIQAYESHYPRRS